MFAIALALLLRAAPAMAVDLGAPGDSRFVWGFYEAETGEGATFRWSGPKARLLLHGVPPGPAILSLRLSGERLVAQGAPRVALARESSTFAAFDVVPGWRVYQVLLPPGALTDTAGVALPLALQTGVSVPGADDDGRDYRALGLPLDWLGLAPLGGMAGPLMRTLWLSWALALLTWAAARLDSILLPHRAGHPLRIATLEVVAAVGLLAWAARDPYGMAWAIPPLPWALGLGTVLLFAEPLLAARSRLRLDIDRRWWAVAGLAILVLAQGLLNSHLAVGAGVALVLVGLLILLAAPQGLGRGLWLPPATTIPRCAAMAILGAIVLLALALRLYQIDALPFGFWRDEARHGLTALHMAADPSYRPVYVTDLRVQLPGLGLAPFAVALQLLGVHIWTMRLVTAAAGALTALPVYALLSRLATTAEGEVPPARGLGLLAALLVAISSWQITISRFSFPTIFEPLLTWTGLWLFDRALRPADGRASRPLAIALSGGLAGVCFGVAAQTYHIGRFAPVMGGLLALAVLIERRAWRRWLLAVLPAALGCLLVLAPLVSYALRQPDDFNVRVGAVFALDEGSRQGRAPLSVLDDSLSRHLLMFNVQGDMNGRHYAPGFPMLDYVTGLVFLLGMAALLRRIANWRSLFLLAALGLGLLPSVLTVDSPHGMRAFEAAPLSCAIAALGLFELLRMLRPEGTRQSRPLIWGTSVALALALGLNTWLYFGMMVSDPSVFQSFYMVQSRMGVYVQDAQASRGAGRIFVPTKIAENETFRYLSYGVAVELFDGATLSSPPQSGDRFVLSGYEIAAELADLAPYLGPSPLPLEVGSAFPDNRGPTFVVYQVP